MKQWNYLQISLDPRHLDQITGLLWDLGTQGIEEQYPRAIEVRIKAYFDLTLDIRSLARSLKSQCRKASVQLQALSSKVENEQDWFKKWRETLKPFAVGRKFYVLPFRDRKHFVPAGRLPIWLEPGMAFGTGTHETTQLCLEAVEDHLTAGMTFLDVGTGSGILALGAAKLGAARIVACDSDPVAIQIARSNAIVNRCSSRLRFIPGEIQDVRGRPFDLVVANLTLEIIEEFLGPVQNRLSPGGKLILSGILNRQLSHLRPYLRRNALSVADYRKKGEWACLAVTKTKQ
jgi:ribosomal protein L11 methyltransferase